MKRGVVLSSRPAWGWQADNWLRLWIDGDNGVGDAFDLSLFDFLDVWLCGLLDDLLWWSGLNLGAGCRRCSVHRLLDGGLNDLVDGRELTVQPGTEGLQHVPFPLQLVDLALIEIPLLTV